MTQSTRPSRSESFDWFTPGAQGPVEAAIDCLINEQEVQTSVRLTPPAKVVGPGSIYW